MKKTTVMYQGKKYKVPNYILTILPLGFLLLCLSSIVLMYTTAFILY